MRPTKTFRTNRPAGPVLLTVIMLFFGTACGHLPFFSGQDRPVKAKQFRSYEFDRGSDLAARIRPAPDFVLDYWSNEDGRPYTDYTLSGEEFRIVRECLSILPETYQKTMKNRLIGIYFIENFLGSGLTDYVLDENGDLYTILLLNPSILDLNLSQLVTRKENTCFAPDRTGLSVAVWLGEDTPGLLYILLHEAAHIVDYVERYTPWVEPDLLDIQGVSRRPPPFTDRLWADYDRFRDDIGFAYKDRVTFYGMNQGPRIDISEAPAVYRAMAKLPVASLYSTINWAEDFAEYLTFFFLTRELGLNYTLTVSDRGHVLFQYQPFANPQVFDRWRDLPPSLMHGFQGP